MILLDEGAHLSQRKLMLPAFHGERMEGLAGLVTEVAEREVASWPRGEPVELHPRLQALTLEILRAVFGVDPGGRFERLRALSHHARQRVTPDDLDPVPPAGERWHLSFATARSGFRSSSS